MTSKELHCERGYLGRARVLLYIRGRRARDEVSETLADQPQAYRPIFMVDDDGSIIARDWAVGFMLGIGLRSAEWGKCILLTKHRQVLIPILVYCEGNLDLLPEMPTAEKRQCQATRP